MEAQDNQHMSRRNPPSGNAAEAPTSAREDTLRSLTTIVEIAALIIGALWTYGKFFATEAPLFSARGKTASKPEFRLVDDGHCQVDLPVTFENIGKSSIDIRRVVVGKVRFNVEDVLDREYMDINKIEAILEARGDKISYSEESNGGPLVREYKPGEKARHSFRWILKANSTKAEMIYFKDWPI